VQTRTLGLPPADGDLFDVSSHLVNGTWFRRRESLEVPLKLMVIDRRVSLFPADPQNLERGYLEVANPGVVDDLVGIFDRYWDGAAKSEREVLPAVALSERERRLVELLADGHTDQSAAHRMRISARSVTSTMRTLMDRLGVENRFQLGLALGALRAASPPSLSELSSSTLPSATASPAGEPPASDQES
jgi:DNA-binding CsgD family transcriptional regulator